MILEKKKLTTDQVIQPARIRWANAADRILSKPANEIDMADARELQSEEVRYSLDYCDSRSLDILTPWFADENASYPSIDSRFRSTPGSWLRVVSRSFRGREEGARELRRKV